MIMINHNHASLSRSVVHVLHHDRIQSVLDYYKAF